MSDWREELLEDLADEITVGHVGSMTSEYLDSGVPFFRSKNINPFRIEWDDVRYISREFHNKLKKSALSPGDVVIVRTGKPGATAVIPDSIPEANCSDLVIIRPGARLDKQFLVYYLNSIASHHIASHLVGAVQQHFNVGAARKLRMFLPNLPEQQRIAHILGTLDDKIELNRRMNRTLEAMAQAIFKSWFVDFEPVRAKAAAKAAGASAAAIERAAMAAISGRSIDEAIDQEGYFDDLRPENRKSLAQTTALFPDSFQDSELGEIPAGWVNSSLNNALGKDVREAVKTGPFGSNLHASDYAETGVPLILVKHVMDGAIAADGTPLVGKTKADTLPQYFLKENDIVVTRVGRVGDTAIVPKSQVGWMFSGQMLRVRLPGGGNVLAQWLAAWYRTPQFRNAIEICAVGSTRASLNTKILAGMQFCLPSIQVQHKFAEFACPLGELASRKRIESVNLVKIRDTLLPQLLSGTLTLPGSNEG